MKFAVPRRAWMLALALGVTTSVLAAPLHDAARDGDTDAARRLILSGADINASDEYGFRPLALALERGHSDIVGMLRHADASSAYPPEAIRTLQRFLTQLGFYDSAIDGVVGSDTAEAIAAFQRSQNLSVETDIDEDWVIPLYATMTREVQLRLKSLGFDPGDIDGVMGNATREAITAFQNDAGLETDPTLDSDWLTPLWQAAEAGSLSAIGEEITADTAEEEDSAEAETETETETASTNEVAEAADPAPDSTQLTQLQQRLQTLGYDPGNVEGNMTPATRVAIRDYQQASGLPVTGEISNDWVLKLDVDILRQTQEQLQSLGYREAEVEVAVGEQTAAAIRAFQEEMGLAVTGEIGEDWGQQITEVVEARAAAAAAERAAQERNRQAQGWLALLGYDPGNDQGEWDEAAANALQRFQDDYELDLGDTVSEETLAALEQAAVEAAETRFALLGYPVVVDGERDDAFSEALRSFRAQQDLPATGEIDNALMTALEQAALSHIQQRLTILGFAPGATDGSHAEQTWQAVQAFQRQADLAENDSWAEDWTTALQKATVRHVQDRLRVLGYRPGSSDGELDDATLSAMRAFQQDNDLSSTDELNSAWVLEIDRAIVRRLQQRLDALEGNEQSLAPGDDAPQAAADPEEDAATNLAQSIEDLQQALDDAETINDTEDAAALASADTDPEEDQVAEGDDPEDERADDRDALQALQQQLAALGYDPGPSDGLLGDATQTAIQAFQQDWDLVVTGEPNEALDEALTTATVTAIQERLSELGYDPGPADGLLGPGTQTAIRRYLADEEVDAAATPNLPLLSALDRTLTERQVAAAAAAEREASIRALQQRLAVLGYEVGTVDGELGPGTQTALRRFQQQNNLPQSDELSAALDEALQTALVRRVQERLRRLDYPVGPVDGEIGNRTTAAIRRFQQQANLTADGQVSTVLAQRLNSAIATQEAEQEAARQREIAARREAERQAAEQEAARQREIAARREAERLAQEQARQRAAEQATIGVTPEVLSSIQINLKALGLYAGSVDGVLGSGTRSAIQTFQRRQGLGVDGKPSNALANQLSRTITETTPSAVKPAVETVATQDTPAPAQPTTAAPTQDVAASATQDTPAPAQPTTAAPTQDVAASATRVTLTVNPDGNASATTPVNVVNSSPPAPSSRVIRRVQSDLATLGLNPGPVDGEMGDRTENAIRDFQRRAGLAVNGQVSDGLLAKLTDEASSARATNRVSGGNQRTEVRGQMKFQRNNGALVGCSVGNVQLDISWCNTFATRRNVNDCRVILRPNAKVLVVNCG